MITSTETQTTSTHDHNAAVERAQLERWRTAPDTEIGYYTFPAEPGGGLYRRTFAPALTGATITTWPGTRIGTITRARVYQGNFGRMVAIRMIGTNGAEYHGRASWDGGTVIKLRRCRS